jgi:aminopeptidase N
LLAALQQLTRVAFPSPRPWIYDGLAHYAQLSFLQERDGRPAVLSYLDSHRDSLLASEKQIATEGGTQPAEHSLINSTDEFYVQAKAMNVWWMLRDIVGETALHAALHNYKAADDKDAYYMQKLIEAQAHRDLAWFFDNWVYRDRGLPDFRIVSVYPRPLLTGGYMLTVMVENLGEAAAEVPVTAHMDGKEASERLMVLGRSKASVRIQAATIPQEVTVNDGSVPESDISNNVYKIEDLNH